MYTGVLVWVLPTRNLVSKSVSCSLNLPDLDMAGCLHRVYKTKDVMRVGEVTDFTVVAHFIYSPLINYIFFSQTLLTKIIHKNKFCR